MSNKKDKLQFEEALGNLEKIILELESGEVPLAQLVEKYQAGNDLLKICHKRLEEAELKIQTLRLNEEGQAEFDTLETEA